MSINPNKTPQTIYLLTKKHPFVVTPKEGVKTIITAIVFLNLNY